MRFDKMLMMKQILPCTTKNHLIQNRDIGVHQNIYYAPYQRCRVYLKENPVFLSRVAGLIILLLIFIPSYSLGDVYKWVDEKGVVHFTDDMIQIPEKNRPTVETISFPEEKVETKREGYSSHPGKGEAYRDQLGRSEEYWRGRVEDWKKKLKTSHEKVETLRIKYNELTLKYNDSKSSFERTTLRRERDQIKNEMDQYKMQFEEAKNMLQKKIPEEAELYKAKIEWIKE